MALARPIDGEERSRVSIRYIIEAEDMTPMLATCPDEIQLKRSVEARIGYTPWDDDDTAARHLFVTVSRGEPGVLVRIELQSSTGEVVGRREIHAALSCAEGIEAAALAIAIAIAPAVALTQAPPASSDRLAPMPNSDVSTTPSPSLTSPAASHGIPGRPPAVFAYLGGLGTWGAVPSVTGGVDVGMGARWRLMALRGGIRYDFPGETETSPGSVVARQLLGQAAICLDADMILGCAGVSLGAMWAKGLGLLRAEKETTFVSYGFARFAGALPPGRSTRIQLYADLTVPFVRQRLLEFDSGHLFWQTPPVGIVWGAEVSFTFFDGF